MEKDGVDDAYGKMYEYGSAENNKNRLTLESNLINVSQMENNLLKNANFNNGITNWTFYGDGKDTVENGMLKIQGNPDVDKNVSQYMDMVGKKGDIFTFMGWVKANAIPHNDTKGVKLSIDFHLTTNDGRIIIENKKINVDADNWQFISLTIKAKEDYKHIRAYIVSSYNANTAYFDNMGIFKEEFGESYQYDDKGNLITTEDNSKNQNSFSYDGNQNLIQSINPSGGKYIYDYSSTNPKQLKGATNSNSNIYSFTYDTYGNMTKSVVEERVPEGVNVSYNVHAGYIGWLEKDVNNGALAGTLKEENQIEAIKVKLEGITGNIKYQSHIQGIGWQNWVQNGIESGTTGQKLRIEAIKIQLENIADYSIEYKVNIEGKGWQDWVKDGAVAGTTGESKKILGIQIRLRDKRTLKTIEAKSEYSTDRKLPD